MTPLTRELAVYSSQIALLVAVCAAAMRASDFSHPQARLACWRTLLAVCLLLPLWPAHVVHVTIPAARDFVAWPGPDAPAAASPMAAAVAVRPGWTFETFLNLLPMVIAAGAIARASWLAAGLVSLRRLAASAGEAIDTPALLEIHARIGSRAAMHWHDGIEQPVAFGLWRPTVLLPSSLKAKPIDVQSAALSHELLHVTRRDWLTGIAEQAVLSAFWFHPAVWWVVDQMELHREQVVDDLSIAAVGSKKEYLRALLEFADKPAPHAALAFGHRQLARRIQHLSREIVMTRSRFALTTVALTIVMTASVFTVASALPLRTSTEYHVVAARAFDARRDAAVSAPAAMAEPAVQQVQVDAAPVLPAHPPELRQGAADVIRQMNDQQQRIAELMKQAQVRSTDLANNAEVQARLQQLLTQLQTVEHSLGVVDADRLLASRVIYPPEALKNGVGATITMTAAVTGAGQVVDVKPAAWSLTIDREITDVGYWAAAPQQAFIDACANALREWTPSPFADETTARFTFTFRPTSTIIVNVERRARDGRLLYPTAPSFSSQRNESNVARVGGDIAAPRKLQNVDPVYPPVAQAAGVQGIVIVEITIAADGTISDAHIIRSVPLLDQAALDAVRQWIYAPTTNNGVAVPVRMTVTVNFHLNQ